MVKYMWYVLHQGIDGALRIYHGPSLQGGALAHSPIVHHLVLVKRRIRHKFRSSILLLSYSKVEK